MNRNFENEQKYWTIKWILKNLGKKTNMEDKNKDSWNDKNFENYDKNLEKRILKKIKNFENEFWNTEKSFE